MNHLTKSLLIAMLAASPLANAQESQYPAADFKPEIISQDAGLIAKHAEASRCLVWQRPSTATQGKPNRRDDTQGVISTGAKPKQAE